MCNIKQETQVQIPCKDSQVTFLEWHLELPYMLDIETFPACLLMTLYQVVIYYITIIKVWSNEGRTDC